MQYSVTILYTELADYSIACLRALKEQSVQIQLIHWPINPEAPFSFDLSFLNEVISREALDDGQLYDRVESFSPDLILCSGWIDKGYVAICRKHQSKAITVLSPDNHWTGSLRQQFARLISPIYLKRAFTKAFVPGQVQKEYALRLGFREENISTGFYSANIPKFESYRDEVTKAWNGEIPKRFLFLGRYVTHKGIFDLWDSFLKLRETNPQWELWCVGTGDQYENRIEGEGIRHFGFVQPDELLPILKECGVYILPSHFEPWGVSVHEMATVGYPMILSDAIGARESFLEGNGRVFKSGDSQGLLEAMQWISKCPNDELMKMSEASIKLSNQNSPMLWAEKILSLINQ